MAELLLHVDQVKRLCQELDQRIKRHQRVEPYIEGECPLPAAVQDARLTKVYRHLMPVAEAPYGSLIVDSKLDRLECSGLRDVVDQRAADRIWAEAWQPNAMDSESQLAHAAALLDGRCYATIWPNQSNPKQPEIALDDCTQMVVQFADGSRRKRVAALRRWQEGDRTYATLYRPDGVFKYQGPEGSSTTTDTWEKRKVQGEEWPLALPEKLTGTIPVVELAVNRRLKPGAFPYARGEYEHCVGLLDRVNLLTFLGLVVAFWMGFPLRGVIGEKIRREVLKDDDGNPLLDANDQPRTRAVPVIDAQPDSFFQLENPEAKLAEYKAADRRNLLIYPELDQLAVITKTPRHYFPMEGGMSNLSAEAIMASEGAMHASVTGSLKPSLGEGWEDVNRLAGRVLGVELSDRAEMLWKDHQSRSLAERADAASKLKDVLPPIAVAELALNASQDQIARWQAQAATDPLVQLLAAANADGVPAG